MAIYNIPCPKSKITDLLEALYDPAGFLNSVIRAEKEQVYARLNQMFPNISEAQRERLAREIKRENTRLRHTAIVLEKYSKISSTGKLLLDASYALGQHVQNCRASNGCLDRYILWLDRKAEEEPQKRSGKSPKQIRIRLDHRILDVGLL